VQPSPVVQQRETKVTAHQKNVNKELKIRKESSIMKKNDINVPF